jgi:hypothetical protein
MLYEDPCSRKLLFSLLKGEIETITPRTSGNVSYPQVESLLKLNRENTLELLGALWEEGYLLRVFNSTIYSCPNDGSTSLRPKVVCPKCRSEDIDRVELVEHLGQGHIDIERRFLKDGKYVCPVCNKTLKTIGVDYRKPGPAYHCLSCNTVHSEPLILWACIQSGHVFTIEDASSTKIYSYSLNPDRVEELQQIEDAPTPEDVYEKIENYSMNENGVSMEFTQQVADVFRIRSYNVNIGHTLKGTSGKKHVLDIYATKPDRTTIIIGFLTDTGNTLEYIEKLSSTATDIKATRVVLIAVPTIDYSATEYARGKGLSVIDGSDAYEATEKLELLMDIEELVAHR